MPASRTCWAFLPPAPAVVAGVQGLPAHAQHPHLTPQPPLPPLPSCSTPSPALHRGVLNRRTVGDGGGGGDSARAALIRHQHANFVRHAACWFQPSLALAELGSSIATTRRGGSSEVPGARSGPKLAAGLRFPPPTSQQCSCWQTQGTSPLRSTSSWMRCMATCLSPMQPARLRSRCAGTACAATTAACLP